MICSECKHKAQIIKAKISDKLTKVLGVERVNVSVEFTAHVTTFTKEKVNRTAIHDMEIDLMNEYPNLYFDFQVKLTP